MTASRETRPGCQVPELSWWMSWTWRRTETRVTMTPRATRATPDQRERPVVWVGDMGFDGAELAEEEAEAADGEANAHEAEAGANPGEEGSLGGEVDSGVLFGGLVR